MLEPLDIVKVKFRPGRRFRENYSSDDVDSYLDDVKSIMVLAKSGVDFEPYRNPKFTMTRSSNYSYDVDDVDDFIVQINLTFDALEKVIPEVPLEKLEHKIKSASEQESEIEEAIFGKHAVSLSLTEQQIDEKSEAIATMFMDNMFDSKDKLAEKVKDMLTK